MTGLTDSPTLVHMYQPPASPGPYNTVPHPPHPHNRHKPQRHQQQHMDHPDQFGDVFNIPSEADVGTLSGSRYLVGYMPPPGDVDGVGGFGECYAQGCKNG